MVRSSIKWIRRIVVVLVLLSAVFVVVSALAFLGGGLSPGGGSPGVAGFVVGFTVFGIVVVVVMIPLALFVVYRVLNSGMLDDF